MIGRPGVLEPRENLTLKKTNNVELSYLFDNLYCIPDKKENFCSPAQERDWLKHGPVYNNGYTFDDRILEDTDVLTAINTHNSVNKQYHITNVDRSSLARVSGKVAGMYEYNIYHNIIYLYYNYILLYIIIYIRSGMYGDKGFNGALNFRITGAAGQSFCAFLGQYVYSICNNSGV